MCSPSLLPPHHSLPSPTPHYGRAHHKPINHPCGLDRHRRNGSVHVQSLIDLGALINSLTVFNTTLSKAQPLIDLGAHLADSSRVVTSQSAVVFPIVGYPSDVRSVVLYATTGALSGLRPGGVLVGSSIDALITGQFAK